MEYKKLYRGIKTSSILKGGVLLLTLIFTACSQQHSLATKKIVFHLSPAMTNQLMRCYVNNLNDTNCVTSIMRRFSASPQAIAFTKLLQGKEFAMKIKTYGDVAVVKTKGFIKDHIVGLYLVTGERAINVSSTNKYGNDLWLDSYKWPKVEYLPAGRILFVFTYQRKICANCKPLDFATIAFKFNERGKLLGVERKLFGIYPTEEVVACYGFRSLKECHDHKRLSVGDLRLTIPGFSHLFNSDIPEQ